MNYELKVGDLVSFKVKRATIPFYFIYGIVLKNDKYIEKISVYWFETNSIIDYPPCNLYKV